MSRKAPDLDAVRREIDNLDERIHDLLMERATALGRIASTKAGQGLFLRAGREAQILRRLVARHRGALPVHALARIWRELISALYRVQGPLEIAVHAPDKSASYWDLARNHFGSVTPMTLHRSAPAVLRLVNTRPNTVAILAAPQDGEADPWWRNLAFAAPGAPRVLAKLPFLLDPPGQFEKVSALVVAMADPEPTGLDISLIAVSAAAETISRARVVETMQKNGFNVAAVISATAGGEHLHLIETPEFITLDDARLAALIPASDGVIQRVGSLGAYASPQRAPASN
jgi:chorismate mutase